MKNSIIVASLALAMLMSGCSNRAADTPEEQEFAQAYGDAWEFVEALERAGY